MFDPYPHGGTARAVHRSRADRIAADAVLGELVTRWAGRRRRIRAWLGSVRFERPTAIPIDFSPPLDAPVDLCMGCLDGQPG